VSAAFDLVASAPTPQRVERAELDYYPTPAWCVDAIKPFLCPGRSVLDPACGQGELLIHFGVSGETSLLGIELDGLRALAAERIATQRVIEADALAVDWPKVDLVICNPPFSLSLEFVEKSLQQQLPHTTHAFLLRLSFLESRERRALHKLHPSDVYVLSERPKFRPNRHGKMATDSITCAWFVWGPGRGGRWSVL
jgi:SAM-dependent methyltransferase